ncbi:MAG: hypothetical protein MK175_04150 [Pseudoalteromonas sp.]|uniref:hypothetical protein n=1 Tax=Pseudoalteromonas sp. TaxID=53249 RepID=UPI0025F7EF28|nr:hypothetical protein [Pseudoalteromonas sp.]MCH2086358.1 hypothetical protein [Pseudoalteromonas sp.]
MFNNLTGAALGAANVENATAIPRTDNSIWGNIGQGVNGALGAAMNYYAQFEQIQAAKKASGAARVENEYTPEYDNGAAVLVDAPKTNQPAANQNQEVMVFGFPQKQVIMAFGGLLVLGLVLKVAKS